MNWTTVAKMRQKLARWSSLATVSCWLGLLSLVA